MKSFLKYIEPKHSIGIGVAILISVLIIAFSGEIKRFEQLGYFGVFLISLLGNATLILPAPGLVFVFLFGATLPNPLIVGLLAGIGATLGEITGFLAGFGASGVVTHTKTYERIHRYVEKYGLWAIFFLALIPNPLFDVAGIAAGALNIRWWKFFLAAGGGKILKSLITAGLGNFLVE